MPSRFIAAAAILLLAWTGPALGQSASGQPAATSQQRPLQTVRLLPARPVQGEEEEDDSGTRTVQPIQGPATLTARPAPVQGLTARPAVQPAQQNQPVQPSSQISQPGLELAPGQALQVASLNAPLLSADLVRGIVANSNLFVAELDYRGLTASQALNVTVAPGVELNLPEYLRSTDLAAQPELSVLRQNPRAVGVIGPLAERNEVFLLEDRLIVSREMSIRVERDACERTPRNAQEREFQETLCFQPVPASQRTDFSRGSYVQAESELGRLPDGRDVANAAAELRDELRRMNPNANFIHGVTVAAALRLSDEQLVMLDANGETREITYVTVIPLDEIMQVPDARRLDPTVVPPAALQRGLDMDRLMGPRVQTIPPVFRQHVLTRADLMPSPRIGNMFALPPGVAEDAAANIQAQQFQGRVVETLQPSGGTLNLRQAQEFMAFTPRTAAVTESHDFYFLTGFTITRSIEDRYQVTFNRRRPYYVRFEYSVGFGFGLRFPFEVRANSIERFREVGPDRWQSEQLSVNLSARGIAGSERSRIIGTPSPYVAAGLPERERLGDQEFVFRLWAGCRLQARIPVVKTIGINCPSVNIPREGTCPDWACRRFAPPIDAGSRELLSLVVPARLTGLQIDAGVLRGGIEPGVSVQARNSNLTMNLRTVNGRFEGVNPCDSRFEGSPSIRNRLISNTHCEVQFHRTGHANRDQMIIGVMPDEGRDPSYRLSDPNYRFTLVLMPFIEVFGVVDVWLASWELRHRFNLPGLSISQEFRFGLHDNTRNERTFGACSPANPRSSACDRAQVRIFD